ncbi:hypothetical protein [Deinococcus hopiensis]|uniref:Uncharacterized protein n=1 Tax=Deinococcus hopiensis KR-140 TaxID=695939 RepID=A0A1W1VRL2_9DEIO|nr:hypothetical protein [Deinococcus hopiensis]SMB96022.1 hypothetical protein SAMN00790413_03116 [Deinococcus hopiensis KR-140]
MPAPITSIRFKSMPMDAGRGNLPPRPNVGQREARNRMNNAVLRGVTLLSVAVQTGKRLGESNEKSASRSGKRSSGEVSGLRADELPF